MQAGLLVHVMSCIDTWTNLWLILAILAFSQVYMYMYVHVHVLVSVLVTVASVLLCVL